MAHAHDTSCDPGCTGCEFEPFVHNHFFNGKLMVADDFIAETVYHAEKMRHHNVRLHGWGVVCGLRVHEHGTPGCRDRYVIVEPGSALDCCGHELLIAQPELLDFRADETVQTLERGRDDEVHALGICLRYRECPTEDVPVLYDECGCDETRCAPNRILESYELGVIADPPLATLSVAGLTGVSSLIVAAKGLSLSIPVGADRNAYAFDPARPTVLLRLDVAHARVTRIDLPGKGIALARGDTYVFVVTEATSGAAGDRLLVVYDPATNALLEWAPGQTSTAIAGSGDSDVHLAATTDPTRALVAVLASSGGILTWPTQAAAPGLGAVQTPGSLAAGTRDIAVTGDGATLYALGTASQAIAVFDLAAGAGKADITMLPATATPSGIAVVPDGAATLLAVSCASQKTLHIVDPGGPTLAASVTLAHPPVEVADGGGGWLQVLEQEGDQFYVQTVGLATPAASAQPLVAAAREVAGEPALVAVGAQGMVGAVDIHGVTSADCADLRWRHLDGCADCGTPDCVMLATIERYRAGMRVEDAPANVSGTAGDLANGIARIDNRTGRKVLASTSTLQTWIECLLDEGNGEQGPRGPEGPSGPAGPGIDAVEAVTGTPVKAELIPDTPSPGQRTLRLTIPPGADGKGIDVATAVSGTPGGAPAATILEDTPAPGQRTLQLTIPPGENGKDGVGTKGDPGEGLEKDLTRIVGTSWVHGLEFKPVLPAYQSAPFVPIQSLQREVVPGLVIVFSRPIRFFANPQAESPAIDSRHVFEVLVDPRVEDQKAVFLPCSCPLNGRVIPLGHTGLQTEQDWTRFIEKVLATAPPSAPSPALWQNFHEILPDQARKGGVWAIAFVVTDAAVEQLRGRFVPSLSVKLHGDFVLDLSGRAIDAEFVRAEFPTGDHPAGSDFGVQGGLFESWLGLSSLERDGPDVVPRRTRRDAGRRTGGSSERPET